MHHSLCVHAPADWDLLRNSTTAQLSRHILCITFMSSLDVRADRPFALQRAVRRAAPCTACRRRRRPQRWSDAPERHLSHSTCMPRGLVAAVCKSVKRWQAGHRDERHKLANERHVLALRVEPALCTRPDGRLPGRCARRHSCAPSVTRSPFLEPQTECVIDSGCVAMNPLIMR